MVIVSGIGRLGKDPKMQYNDKGNAITNLNVAVTSGFGEKEETTWFSLVSYGKQAELLNQYLEKGSRLNFVAEFTKVRTFEKADKSTGISVDAKILTFSFVDKGAKQEPEDF